MDSVLRPTLARTVDSLARQVPGGDLFVLALDKATVILYKCARGDQMLSREGINNLIELFAQSLVIAEEQGADLKDKAVELAWTRALAAAQGQLIKERAN